MATQLQLRRGTTSQVAAFTGANGEVVVDTEKKTLFVNDGSTAGGLEIARADFSNISASASLTLGTLTATTLNVTTLDLTNLEVTNIKGKDGTSAGSIADSTGVVTIASAVLTTADINAGTVDVSTVTAPTVTASTSLKTPLIEYTDGDDAITIADGGGVTIADLTATTADINGGTFDGIVGGTTPAAGSFTTLSATDLVTFSKAASVQQKLSPGNDSFAAQTEYYNGTSSSGPLTVGQGYASGTDNIGYVWQKANANLLFGTNSTLAMTIDSSQNVVIGDTSSLRQLTLYNTGSSLMAISAGTSNHAGVFYYDGSTEMFNQYYDNSSDQYFLSSSASANQFVISQATGNVHIGTDVGTSQVNIYTGNVTGAGTLASSAINIAHTTHTDGMSQMTFGYQPGSLTYASAYIGYIGVSQAGYGNGDIVMGTRDVTTDSQPTEHVRIPTTGITKFRPKSSHSNIVDLGTYSGGQSSSYIRFEPEGTSRGYIGNGSALLSGAGDTEFIVRSEGDLVLNAGGNNRIVTIDTDKLAVSGMVRFSASGADATRWSVYWNGSTGDLIVVSSDKRLKKDFDYDLSGIETIKKLKPVRFTWKESERRQLGFLAQDSILADEHLAWNDTETDQWGLDGWEGYAAMLAKAIQEQQALIETLQAEVKALKEA